MKLEQLTLRSKGWILEEIEDANKPTRVEPEEVEPVLNPMQKEVEKRQKKVKAIIAKRMAASQKAAEETKAPDHCELPKAHEQLCKGRKEVAELVESLKAKGMRFFVKRVDEGDCRYKVFYEEANPIHDLDDEHLEVDGYRIHKTDDGKWVIEDTLEVFDKKEDAVNKAFEYGKHPVNDPMPKVEEHKPIDWNETLNEAEEASGKPMTEAPDGDGIETDDELDAEEQMARDELEKRLQARRAEVARARKARDEKSARRQELMVKAQDKLKAIGDDWSFEHLFNALVPDSGRADTLAGEIIRAVGKIGHRWFNDGDRFFEDYGIETCGSPALFLMDLTIGDGEGDGEQPFYDILEGIAMDSTGDERVDAKAYDEFVDDLKAKVVEVIKANPTLLAIEDHEDMNSNKYADVVDRFENIGMIPEYDLHSDLPRELEDHIDVGDIDEDDIRNEVESWVDNYGGRYEKVAADAYGVDIIGAELKLKNELDSGSLYDWLEEYARQLDDEFGDPDGRFEAEEEDDEEEVEEESLDLPEAKPEAKTPEKRKFAKKVVPPGVQMDDDDMDAPMQFNEAEAHAMIGDKPIIEEGRSQIEIANDFSSTSMSGDALAALEADDNI